MRYLLVFALACGFFTAGAQTPSKVRRVDAYLAIRLPGTIPVDDLGGPMKKRRVDSLWTIVAETRTPKMTWGFAWRGGRTYTVAATRVTDLKVGRAKEGGAEIYRRPAAGNYLWQLELIPYEGHKKAPARVAPGAILIQGKAGTTPFYRTLRTFTELDVAPSV
ncbi:MAG: hypothetical protein EOO11_00465 [Chitinophagaceae bacterium]|nr:MAG: hypothetical protein EOO11_00465 [Chitinophagaceae bacterium]